MIKVTKKVALEVAISALSASSITEYRFAGEDEPIMVNEVIDKLNTMIAQLDAKANAPKKPTKVQEANEILKATIIEILEGQSPMTVSEIMTRSNTLAALSNQKVASLARRMVEDNVLIRTEKNHKAYFTLANGEGV